MSEKKLTKDKKYFYKNISKPETKYINDLGWSTTEWLEMWDKSTDWYQRYTNKGKRTRDQRVLIGLFLCATPLKLGNRNTVNKARKFIDKDILRSFKEISSEL